MGGRAGGPAGCSTSSPSRASQSGSTIRHISAWTWWRKVIRGPRYHRGEKNGMPFHTSTSPSPGRRRRPAPRRRRPGRRVAARPAGDPVAVAAGRAGSARPPPRSGSPTSIPGLGPQGPPGGRAPRTRPGLGSSRSRQATKRRPRAQPYLAAMAASSAGPVGAGSADRLGDGTSTGATGRRRTDGASARSSGGPAGSAPARAPPRPSPAAWVTRRPPTGPAAPGSSSESSRPDTRDGRTPPRRGAWSAAVAAPLRWAAASGGGPGRSRSPRPRPTPPGPRGRPGPWPVAPRGRPPPPRWPPPHPPPAGR